jgi:hypothetical protein
MTSTLRNTLRTLAQSDARMMRDIQALVGPAKPRQIKGGKSSGSSLSPAPKKPRKSTKKR